MLHLGTSSGVSLVDLNRVLFFRCVSVTKELLGVKFLKGNLFTFEILNID